MRINYAARPLYENPEIRSLALAEFEAIVAAARGHSFKWTESLGSIIQSRIEGFDPSIADRLVICQTDYGFSVFALEFIPKGTPLFPYAGEAISLSEAGGDPYILNMNRDPDPATRHGLVSARRKSNWAGMVQHASNVGPLATHSIAEIEYANLEGKRMKGGCPWFYTRRDIEKGTQLSWDYGDNYVSESTDHLTPFDREGRALIFKSELNAKQVFDILRMVAETMGDESTLKNLAGGREVLPKVESICKTWQEAYREILVMPDDFWFCLKPTERNLLSRFLQENSLTIIKDGFERSVETYPYKAKLLARFRAWTELPVGSTSPGCVVKLSIPADFSAGNAARFYVGYTCLAPQLANKLIAQAIAEANKCYKAGDYLLAVTHFQSALRDARDALSYQWFQGLESTLAKSGAAASETIELGYEICSLGNNGYLFDERVVVGFWNLGSAYLKAGDLREAEYCVSTAVAMIKTSKMPVITARLTKYEERLTEIRDRISGLTPAAAGGAGAVMSESSIASAGLFAAPRPVANSTTVSSGTGVSLTTMPPVAAGGAGADSAQARALGFSTGS